MRLYCLQMLYTSLVTVVFPAAAAFSFGQTYSTKGMVVSDNTLASEVGAAVLSKGGNAIDAAIATGFALAVVHPQAGNLGGGGFMVFMPDSGEVTTVDFREKAPMAATADMFLDDEGNLPRGNNHRGLQAVGVPGTVSGFYLAHQHYGHLPWSALVQPAIDLARDGFPLTWTLSKHAQRASQHGLSPFMREFFRGEDGQVLGFGDIWKQPELARTLEAIRDQGADGFYAGEVALEIARLMREGGGLITAEDLERYEAVLRKPVHGTYKGYDIYSMPPPSSGGVALLEMLNMFEQVDSVEVYLPFNSTNYYHYLIEIMRRAYADRAEFMGDPDFNPDLPLGVLTSKEHAATRYASIHPNQASPSDSIRFGQIYEGEHTTHLSVMDANGNAVSLTYTLEQSYGSQLGSEKLGFILNNEMGDFNPQSGTTRSNGQIGSYPNLIEPEKRMLSSMTPTIVARDGEPYLVIGSPGGRTIINTVFQTVLCVLEYEMDLDRAIEASKIHHQWLPNYARFERHLISPEVLQDLQLRGHRMKEYESLGRLMGILHNPDQQVFIGAADSSSPDGGATGVE